jgi:hypothetical protein
VLGAASTKIKLLRPHVLKVDVEGHDYEVSAEMLPWEPYLVLCRTTVLGMFCMSIFVDMVSLNYLFFCYALRFDCYLFSRHYLFAVLHHEWNLRCYTGVVTTSNTDNSILFPILILILILTLTSLYL